MDSRHFPILLKWVGGKRAILDRIRPLVPRHIQNYIEPFVGGGSLLLMALDMRARGEIVIDKEVRATDKNAHLIHFYRAVQEQPAALYDRANAIMEDLLGSEDREEKYYALRAQFNSSPPGSIEAAALFAVLNKTCYRGLFRVNKQDLFNTPYGHYKNPRLFSRDEVLAFSDRIAGVHFEVKDVLDALSSAAAGDFLMLDPPYTGKFDGYTAEEFPREGFVRRVRDLTVARVSFVLCESVSGSDAYSTLSGVEKQVVKQGNSICERKKLCSVIVWTDVNYLCVRDSDSECAI